MGSRGAGVGLGGGYRDAGVHLMAAGKGKPLARTIGRAEGVLYMLPREATCLEANRTHKRAATAVDSRSQPNGRPAGPCGRELV